MVAGCGSVRHNSSIIRDEQKQACDSLRVQPTVHIKSYLFEQFTLKQDLEDPNKKYLTVSLRLCVLDLALRIDT